MDFSCSRTSPNSSGFGIEVKPPGRCVTGWSGRPPISAAQTVHHVLHPNEAGDPLPKGLQHSRNAGITVVVRHRQHVQMDQVAGHDLTDGKEVAQDGRLLADLDARRFLDGQNRRGHVRDRADPADARDDVADLVILAADQEAFEEPRRLEDLQLQKRRPVQLDRQSRLAFHPRHVIDFYFCAYHVHRPSAPALGLPLHCGFPEFRKPPEDVFFAQSHFGKPVGQGPGMGVLHGSPASVALPIMGRTQGAAARVGHRPHAGPVVGDQHADVVLELALDAHGILDELRPLAQQQRGDELRQVALAHGAAFDIAVHRHVLVDRMGPDGRDLRGVLIDPVLNRVLLLVVLDGRNAAADGAGADRESRTC